MKWRRKITALIMSLALLIITSPTLNVKAATMPSWSYDTPGVYTITLAQGGLYKITCVGAKGGDDIYSGGRGSLITGYFMLQGGQQITITVGEAGKTTHGTTGTIGGGGGTGSGGISGEGGGASSVVLGGTTFGPTTPSGNVLIVAGGGGGVSYTCPGGDADAGSYGSYGYGSSAPGCPSSGDGGGGGGGYYGGIGTDDGTMATGGQSYVNTSLGSLDTLLPGSNAGAGSVYMELCGFYIYFDGNVYMNTESVLQGTMEPQFICYGTPTNLNWNQFSLKGYVWLGWNTNKSATGTHYEDHGVVIGY